MTAEDRAHLRTCWRWRTAWSLRAMPGRQIGLRLAAVWEQLVG